ncbi:MAG: NAD(+)/NADH kinase [Eubacteriales bacterium]
MTKITVIPNRDKDPDLIYTGQVIKRLLSHGCEVAIDDISGATYVIVIGGDGSILRAARQTAPLGIPLLCINLGRLGYMTELEIDELSLIDNLFCGNFTIEERMMLSVEIIHGDSIFGPMNALNDAVVSNGAVSRMIDIDLYCGDSRVGRYRADGLICATPTGSTAYSLSAGGPVIDPQVGCICVTPVSPHSLRAKPMIFNDKSILEIRDNCTAHGDLYITIDGNENHRLDSGDMVRITRSSMTTCLIRIKKNRFYDILYKKMSE